MPSPFYLTADDCLCAQVGYKTPNDAMVGLYQDLPGNSAKQVEEIIEKVYHIHQSMHHILLPHHLAWIGLHQSIWKSIDYVLSVTFTTHFEVSIFLKEFYRLLLPKLGCNRNFPLKFMPNPPFLIDLGLKTSYIEQGLYKVLYLITHGEVDNLSRTALNITNLS